MDAFGESNCTSVSSSFSVYERYLKSFNVSDPLKEEHNSVFDVNNFLRTPKVDEDKNVDLLIGGEAKPAAFDAAFANCADHFCSNLECTDEEQSTKILDSFGLDSNYLMENSSVTEESNMTDRSNNTDVPVTSEDSKSSCTYPKPVIITSLITMENSNNAVDSVPLFTGVKSSDNVFKLPIRELSFNGTLKHVQKLKPIVDPISALTSVNINDDFEKIGYQNCDNDSGSQLAKESESMPQKIEISDNKEPEILNKISDSTGDSQYDQSNHHKEAQLQDNSAKWTSDSFSSLEASFDSGVRSPDMFSDGEEDEEYKSSFWDFLGPFEVIDKQKVKKMEVTLQGVLPPPSVTILKTNVTEMLKKYYSFLPAFQTEENSISVKEDLINNHSTPTKRTSFVNIPTTADFAQENEEIDDEIKTKVTNNTNDKMNEGIAGPSTVVVDNSHNIETIISNVESKDLLKSEELSCSKDNSNNKDIAISAMSINENCQDKLEKCISNVEPVDLKSKELSSNGSKEDSINKDNASTLNSTSQNCQKGSVDSTNNIGSKEDTRSEQSNFSIKKDSINDTEIGAKNNEWPEVMKCRFYDVHYNITRYSERLEQLSIRCGERHVGAETDSSLTVFSGGLHSPTSASKRKAIRLKLAQAKSPGRRLSHLARRRYAFNTSIGDKASTSKMVLIDKNFFPHRKLIASADRKSPRHRRTPGRKTPAKKTPAKTPKTRSGGSSRKKAMRRLLLDPDNLTRSQPTRETLKRALFVSPENRKPMPVAPSTSVPLQAMKSKRALFGSPEPFADTKSADGSQSDIFLKRKRDLVDGVREDSRNKVMKSLSFGGDSIGGTQQHSFSRRSSEMFGSTSRSQMADLDENQRKKLLWAVSEALRIHGWRMHSPGFREKAAALAQLTRRLMRLPTHAAKLAAPKLSTSETLLKIARQYVYSIIKGRTVDECFQDEVNRLSSEGSQKLSGYISAAAYQQLKTKSTTNQVKENNYEGIKPEHTRSNSKNILQDKLLNVDTSSNSNSGFNIMDKTALYKSNSMPSFEEAAKMRARRQISFDNVDFPKR